MGSAGPDQFWDFSKGPTDRVYRFDYLNPAGLEEAADFPQATIVEKKTDQDTGKEEWLFFQPVPGTGRRVYGFYAENILFSPSNVFVPPIVDFPDQISFGQEWTTSTVYENTVSGTDPDPEEEGGMFDIRGQTTLTSNFKVDAYGTILLPEEIGDFGPGLRINEELTIDLAFEDGEGNFQHVETDYARNYYWVMPGRGIVAQLASVQSGTPPPENFGRATQFWRMFQTNKKAATNGGCAQADPVADLKIRVSAGQVLLTWSKANCAAQYRVEYSGGGFEPLAWQTLGMATNQLFALDAGNMTTQRFYRVVSIK
jgi:hypothetical protein